MTTKEILQAARDLISDAEQWTRGSHARNAYGHSVCASAPAAVKFCVAGAILRCAGPEGDGTIALQCVSAIAVERYGLVLAALNDDREHREVLAVLDAAVDAQA